MNERQLRPTQQPSPALFRRAEHERPVWGSCTAAPAKHRAAALGEGTLPGPWVLCERASAADGPEEPSATPALQPKSSQNAHLSGGARRAARPVGPC